MDLIMSIVKIAGAVVGYVLFAAIIKKFIAEPFFKRICAEEYYKTVQGIFIIVVQLALYIVIRRYIFLLPVSFEKSDVYFLVGMVLGSILIFISIGILKLFKVYAFKKNKEFSDNPVNNIFTIVVFFMVLALFEEIAVRGILYTGLQGRIGTLWTMIVVTVLFVIPHLKNKGINIFSVTSLIIAGILLNLLRMYSGDIWLPLGFHFAWNFIQGIIGFNVSGGNEMTPIYKVIPKGKKYLSGGEFGIEASIITLVILIIFTASMILYLSL